MINVKKVGSTIVSEQVQPSRKPVLKEYDIIKANKRIAELEASANKTPEVDSEGYHWEVCKNVHSPEWGKMVKIKPLEYKYQSAPPTEIVDEPPKSTIATTSRKTVFEYVDSVDNNPKTKSPCHFFVKEKFYLCFDGGKCYLWDTLSKAQGNVPTILIKAPNGEANPYSITTIPSGKVTHMTKLEYDNIIQAKPTREQILSVWQRLSQQESPNYGIYATQIDITKAISIW